MVLLTVALGLVAVAVAGKDAGTNPGLFYFNLLTTLAGLVGVFLAEDLLLFFGFYEVMLVPAYFLIVLWGDVRQRRATYRHALLHLHAGRRPVHACFDLRPLLRSMGAPTGIYTLAYIRSCLDTPMVEPSTADAIVCSGFVVAFVGEASLDSASWMAGRHLRDRAHKRRHRAFRCHGESRRLRPVAIRRYRSSRTPRCLVAPWVDAPSPSSSILYGGLVAFAQTDLRRFIAYSGISHLGFRVARGVRASTTGALPWRGNGADGQPHGVSATGLFLLASLYIEERAGNARDMSQRLAGIWRIAPRLGAFGLDTRRCHTWSCRDWAVLWANSSYFSERPRMNPVMAALGALGAVLATAYALRLMQRVFLRACRTSPPMGQASDLRRAGRRYWRLLLVVLALLDSRACFRSRCSGSTDPATSRDAFGSSGRRPSRKRPRYGSP